MTMITNSSSVPGKTNREVFGDELAVTLDYIDRQVIASGRPVQTELEANLRGETRFYLATKFPIFDEGIL
jgi:PAS fold.